MTEDEILKEAGKIRFQRIQDERAAKLVKQKALAERMKDKPYIVAGEIKTVYEEWGADGHEVAAKADSQHIKDGNDYDIYGIKYVLGRLPKGTKVRVTIQVLEVGEGSLEDADNYFNDDDD